MGKVNIGFISKSYKNTVSGYKDAVEKIGLWKSEVYILGKYFEKEKKILDIGCGAGRTTFAFYEKGYNNIIGLDLSKYMLKAAEKIRETKGYNIKFIQGDARNLKFRNDFFDYSLFSFNGIMQIPYKFNRIKALREIKRVLKPGGVFVFTTHDREKATKYKKYWEREKERWHKNLQDTRLTEYGDRIIKTDKKRRDFFIHIPDRVEVIECIKKVGFKHVEDFYRSDLFRENLEVKKFSDECRFWVVQKV